MDNICKICQAEKVNKKYFRFCYDIYRCAIHRDLRGISMILNELKDKPEEERKKIIKEEIEKRKEERTKRAAVMYARGEGFIRVDPMRYTYIIGELEYDAMLIRKMAHEYIDSL